MATSPNYIVVIGAARSGTKFLRDVLASSSGCRKIPYDVNSVWMTGNQSRVDDELALTDYTPAIRDSIGRQLRHSSGWRPDAGAHSIVEKTVSNCLRVPLVDRVLPRARYVHLVRDGRDVVESSFAQWNTPVQWSYLLAKLRSTPLANWRYILWSAGNVVRSRLAGSRGVRIWGVRYRGIEEDLRTSGVLEVCARQWSKCVVAARRDLQSTAADRTLEVRYERLVQDSRELRRICDFLELSDTPRVLEYYQSHLQPVSSGCWQLRRDDPRWHRTMEILTPALVSLGYLPSETTHRKLAA